MNNGTSPSFRLVETGSAMYIHSVTFLASFGVDKRCLPFCITGLPLQCSYTMKCHWTRPVSSAETELRIKGIVEKRHRLIPPRPCTHVVPSPVRRTADLPPSTPRHLLQVESVNHPARGERLFGTQGGIWQDLPEGQDVLLSPEDRCFRKGETTESTWSASLYSWEGWASVSPAPPPQQRSVSSLEGKEPWL